MPTAPAPPSPAAALLLLLLPLWLDAGPRGALAAVLSSSKLEACLNDGSEKLSCDSKIVVTVSLEHGQDTTESAEFLVREVGDEDNKRSMLKPWRVSWSKSQAYWRYPLVYLQEVNNKPTEKVFKVPVLSCRDSPGTAAGDLTCGVAMLGNQRVVDSQGFCCGCDAMDFITSPPTRGGINCFTQESAHCLRFDDLWYSLFSVGPPEVTYDITVSVDRPTDPTASWQDIVYDDIQLTVSHRQPFAQAADGTLIVQLVGDFATAAAPHSFESRYLAAPWRPAGHPRIDDADPLAWAMLVDKSMFDLSGVQCDKIGISYTAFRTRQASRCEIPSGSCLSGQLDDLHKEDLKRAERGEQTRYFVSGFCSGGVQLRSQQSSGAGREISLSCPLTQRQTTMLRLEARAEEAMFVTNLASGEIVSATCSEFEAMKGVGEVKILIVSTGRVKADFSVGLANCSSALVAAPAVIMSLQSYESREHTFGLQVSQDSGGSFACTATLHNSLGALLDTKVVQVNITDLQRSTGNQVPVDRPGEGEGDDVGGDEPGVGDVCSAACGSFFDILCFLMLGCWEQIFMAILVVACIVGVCCCGWRMGKAWLWRLICGGR